MYKQGGVLESACFLAIQDEGEVVAFYYSSTTSYIHNGYEVVAFYYLSTT